MTQLKIGTLAVALAASASITQAQETSDRYLHNGSVMAVTVLGDHVEIRYQTPRPGLQSVGVTPGALLFHGDIVDGYVEGFSNLFTTACGVMDYFVYGDFTPGQTFTLNGAAPVLAQTGCQIVDNSSTVANATLVFAPQQTGGCLHGVNTTLNVRVGPAADYGVIAQLPATTCDVRQIGRCDGAWCAIVAGNVTGWVDSNYLAR